MLILARKSRQKITITVPPSDIPQEIEVSVVSVRGDIARLGFECAKEIRIVRDDVIKTGLILPNEGD